MWLLGLCLKSPKPVFYSVKKRKNYLKFKATLKVVYLLFRTFFKYFKHLGSNNDITKHVLIFGAHTTCGKWCRLNQYISI